MFNKLKIYLTFAISLFLCTVSIPTIAADKSVSLANKTQTIAKEQSVSKISINKASDKQLATIKGIGVKKAKAIVDYRKLNGKFTALKDLTKVKGIGETTFNKIKPFISL